MNRTFSQFLSISVLSTSLFLGCGGGGAQGPTTLRYHYDEVHIAQFSLEEKSTVLSAQNEYQRARAEQMKVESELTEGRTAIKVAQNERKQAMLAEKSAGQEKSAATASGDMNRINRATRDQRAAELERRAADDKVTYLKTHQKYLKKLLRYRQEETYHREARYEYEKAKLGQAKNIAPKGIKYEDYKGQVDERSRRSQKAKLQSEQAKQRSVEAERSWKARIKEVEQAKGTSSAGSGSTNDDTSGDSAEN